jgi:hypothetical protein
MTTLGEYLDTASGTFTSPNHPVPATGREIAQTLGDGTVTVPGHTTYDVDLFDLEVEAVEQPSGDIWLYPAGRELSAEEGPYLIHHPAVRAD